MEFRGKILWKTKHTLYSEWLQGWPRLLWLKDPLAGPMPLTAGYCHHRDSEAWWAQTWQAYKQIYRTWQSNAPHNNKIRLLQVTLETVLLYGAEAWTRASGIERTLGCTYTWPLRYVLGIRWQDQQTNTQVHRNNQPESEKLWSKWLNLVRHSARMNNYTPQLVQLFSLSVKTNF